MKKYNVYAIIRLDNIEDWNSEEALSLKEIITITKIVATQEEADAEVVRLNNLNKNKGCVYYSDITRTNIVSSKD